MISIQTAKTIWTEIHHNAAFVEIQRLDHVGWPLPMISLAFDLLQRIESLNALVEVAQQEKKQYRAHYEQCYAYTIRSLDTGIGDRYHVRDGNSLTQISDRRAPRSDPD